MTSRARSISPRRSQLPNSLKKHEIDTGITLHPGRHPLRPIPEASQKSSSTSEQTEPGSPSRAPTPRGKKRGAAVYRQNENVDGNIGSASNTPEKPREKRTTLTRPFSKITSPWPSKLPVTASLARAMQESLQQTDADSVSGTSTTNNRTPAISNSEASKTESTDQTPRAFRITGKPPLDSETSKTWVSSSNSSFLQSTPSRASVNRSLRYGGTPGSAASTVNTRAPGSGRSSGSFQFHTGQQILAQQFDFEEDPTFWEDHNVQVILRTRPISTSESAVKGFSRCVRQENPHSITWIGQPESRFTFDHVAGEYITQERLFRVAGVPMVDNSMAGYNSCMFCYGQTGSGKTYTMLGDIVDLEHRPSDNRGITPRVFEYLFSRIQREEEARTNEHLKYVCKCSFLEIFNEQITDLLEPTSTNLQMREGGKKGVYVDNLSEVEVGSVQDVVHLLLLGAANRKVAATNMNRESSRSHSVFTCTIESKWESNSMTNIRFGRLNLVDLAGSERQKNSGAEGERLKEAANINKSLSTLGLVIMILVDVANGKQRHVPYRDSKLTYLLQDSLGGNSKTTMIANISPSSCCALETLSTLKFAQRAKFIRNNAVVNEDGSGDVNGLRQEIQELKEELDRMRMQGLPRTPSMHSIASIHEHSVHKGDTNPGMAVVTVDEQEQSRCSLDSWEFSKAFASPRFPHKKLEAMEAVLAGALRREQEAELSQKRQGAEIEQLTRLVKQREDDSQCSKMLLRFREEKIRRLESLSAGITPADTYLMQENVSLLNELQLIQAKVDRNPELTRFAMENIRLLEQLRRFQDFYTGGEREAMADEISNLRDQLLEVLDSKLSLRTLTSPQREALAPELAAAKREIELLQIEVDNYRREVEDCRKNLSSSLEANSRLTKQLDESSAELRKVKLECQVHQKELHKLRDQVLNIEAEWCHVQHSELTSNLMMKLQQTEDRSERESSMRPELHEELNAPFRKAADFQAELQETRRALNAAEMLASRLQSGESSLSVAQEMAAVAQDAVRQIHLETKEIAEDQRLSLQHIEDTAFAARMKESELLEEPESHFLIAKLSSTKEELKCFSSAVASLSEEEQAQEILDKTRDVSIIELEQDLKSLELLSESTHQNTISVGSARKELDIFRSENSITRGEKPLYLEHINSCMLKLNFDQEEGQRADDLSQLKMELETTIKEVEAAQSLGAELPGDRDLQVLQTIDPNPIDLENMRAICSLQKMNIKLEPHIDVIAEQRKKAVLEGISDDSLTQPTAVDRVREQEPMNVQHVDVATSPVVKTKDTDHARLAGGIKRNFAVCTTMLRWFSETLALECAAKNMLRIQNERTEEELRNKDCLISSLQTELERATVCLFEKSLLVSELQDEHNGYQARLLEAEAQVASAVNVQATLLEEIEKHRVELATVLKRMEDTELELAQIQDVLTREQVELIGCERKRERLVVEKEQLAAAFSYYREVIGRSSTVATIMVWWLQNKIAADEYFQKLNYDDLVFLLSERDRMVVSQQDEITRKTLLLEEHMGHKEILINQNSKHMQEIDNAWKEIAMKDALLGVMQTDVLRLQDELLASEDRSFQLTMEKKKLHKQLSESAEFSKALEGKVSKVQSDLQEAEAKVVELAIVQTGMFVVQGEWELDKERLERHTTEAKKRCTQLKQELELACNVAQKFQSELEEAKTEATVLREERDKVVTYLQEELNRTQVSADAFKDQFEHSQGTVAELDSRLQKHLKDWDMKKETTFSAAMIAQDQCLEKNQVVLSIQASFGTLLSQLFETYSRETQLSHELEEVLELKEKIQIENERLRSKTEELVFAMNQQGQEIYRQEHDLELKLQKADDKVENMYGQMKAILVDLDSIILTKKKLEEETECIEHKILHHCSNIEQELAKAHEDRNQIEDLSTERESTLLRKVNTLQSENVAFCVRIQALEVDLEGSKVLIQQKEEEMASLRREWTESESKAVQTQEKLDSLTLLLEELAHSQEQWRIQKEALAAENKRLTSCMACQEMEFSTLQDQKASLEKSLQEVYEKEGLINIELRNFQEKLTVLEQQSQDEIEQLNARLVTVNRELVDSQELKQGYYNALNELEQKLVATENNFEVTLNELETQWNIEKVEMENRLSKVSLDFVEVKNCAEKIQLDLANTRSLLSAADSAIKKLLYKRSVMEDSYTQLLAEHEVLRLQLSHWEQYATELQESSFIAPSPRNESRSIADSEARPSNDYFDIVKREVERTSRECETLRAQVLDKDDTILSMQMELSAAIASSRQVEIELECAVDERSDLKLQLKNINRALTNAQDEVRCRELQLEQFETELHKIMDVLVKTEEKMDESELGWRKQIEGAKAEMEVARLCAIEKGSEVTMLRRQFEEAQSTLQEAEHLVNALVLANDSAKRDVHKWKSREEEMTLQSSEMLGVIEEEVSVTMYHVEKHMQVLGLEIHGMRMLLKDSCLETTASFNHELKECFGIQNSDIERAAEGALLNLAKINAKVMDSEQRLHQSVMGNEALKITLNSAEDLLRVSRAALGDAVQNVEAQHKGWAATRDELQGALASLLEKDTRISEFTSECDLLFAKITELERLLTERCEELTINESKLKELEMEKLTLVEATEMQQVANNHLHGRIQQIEMSLAEEMNTKQVMEMEISSLRQQLGCFENQIHKFEADLAASHVALKVAAAKLLETESTIRALNTDLDISRDEMVCVQGSLENAVTELNDLGQHAHELELKEVHLMAQAATQRHVLKSTADKLVQAEVESDATMGILASILESTSSELRDKETVIADMKRLLEENDIKFSTTLAPLRVAVSQMRQEKEFLLEKASVLADDKKDLVERLELQSKQLCKQFQETSAASTAHEFQLEILKTVIESVSNELQEKDLMTSALREKLEESSAHALDILASLQTAMLASAQIEHERDELLETANKLEMDKRVFKEEVEKQSRKCSDLELQILRLQNELQDVSTLSHKQKLDLEILTTMLESAVKESKEKDAMATDLENLLSQSQLQNAEMLQSSQEVVNHFSLFQSQLDACFQQNKELERNKLVLTAEVHSQSKEMDKLKAQLKTAENSLDEMRNSFGQLNERKDQEVRGLSIEFELLKSQVAVMEADLWDWEQRCQDTEVQLDEKDSELDILRGKLLATQGECKEQVELMYDELRGCQHHIAEMESERRDLINEIEEASATVAKIQDKLQTMENEMEEHFTRHCIEQEELDSLQNEKRELQVSVKHLISEVAATQQRAAAAENMHVETKLEMEALERDLKQKDDLLQSLEYDLNVLQESALQELHLKQELDSLRVTKDALQQELNMQKERRTRLEMEIGQGTEEIVQFRNQAATWKGKAYELETELDKKRQIIESLEDELRMAEENMANTLEEVTVDLKEVENDRDRLQMEALELTEKLEMTQAMVEERDVIASELHQAAERSNTQAKEKEDEVKLLTRSVEELDSTIYALESQLGSLKREAERQRLLREDTEMKLQKLNNHIFVMESALNESNTLNADELKDALSALKEVERKVQEKESEIAHLQRKLENLEILSKDKDVQITDAMAQISDLLLAAEVQKADFQQKLKRMEIAVDQPKTGNREVLPVCTTPNSIEVATELDSSSANLTQEALSQSDLHVSCGCRIKELEDLASSRQKELFVLNTRLAEAESMTHDVLRDLVGVKTDMNNYASMLGHQQIQELAETARRKKLEVEEMEAELSSLRLQITNYIEERKSGIEEVNLRQCEMVAAHVATETLRQKEQMLSNEIGLLKIENTNHQERIRELETEIRRFPAGQHSFQEQINHHAKIKEENQALKLANEELSKELRRTELLYAGMHDEVARYRAADQRSTSPSFDEDLQNLRRLLQEAEDSRILAAQNLSVLCTAIMQAAGLSSSENVNSSSAIDALQLLESRLQTAEQVISDKYKMKSTGERRKRTNIRAKDSPLRSISNFTDLLHRASSPSSAPR